MAKTVLFETLGCRLNQADSALMTHLFESAGYEILPSSAKNTCPDVIVVNTCGVTAQAMRKSRQAFRQIRGHFPEACCIVTGCGVNITYAEWEKEEGVNILLRPTERSEIIERLNQFYAQTATDSKAVYTPHSPRNHPTHHIFHEKSIASYPYKSRAFLKIQEGCNNFCSYCIVPYARGPERSRDIEEIMAEFQSLQEAGHHEIILAGVNTSTFRFSGGGLSDLIEKLIQIPGDFRIRLSSAEPHPEIRKVLNLMKDFPEKLCRFLHLPAQHLTPEILKSMNRPYSLETYCDYVRYARETVPDLHLGTDFIVGFPGETDALFESAFALAQTLKFSNIHLFPFSPRPGTAAANFTDTVQSEIVRERMNRMLALSEEARQAFHASQVGKNTRILVESIDEAGVGEGWSDHYIRGKVPAIHGPKLHALSPIIPLELADS